MSPGRIVFIVDRDQAVRDSLRFSIELDGMDVRTCGSSQELVQHPEVSRGSCAIIDGKTLHRDGPEALKRLQVARKALPIVLIVDHVSRRQLAGTIAEGSFRLVDKPVLDDALLRCVRACVESGAALTRDQVRQQRHPDQFR